jgi:hypothetical protein
MKSGRLECDVDTAGPTHAAERRALGPIDHEPEAERDLARAALALAVVEPDPALVEEGVLVPADPAEPILELLAIVDLESARELLVASTRIWLDPRTWTGLEALAARDPDRCRAALEAALARDPAALDRVLDGLEVEPTETAPCSKCAA